MENHHKRVVAVIMQDLSYEVWFGNYRLRSRPWQGKSLDGGQVCRTFRKMAA